MGRFQTGLIAIALGYRACVIVWLLIASERSSSGVLLTMSRGQRPPGLGRRISPQSAISRAPGHTAQVESDLGLYRTTRGAMNVRTTAMNKGGRRQEAARDVLTNGADLSAIATDLYWVLGYTLVAMVLAGISSRGACWNDRLGRFAGS